MYGVRSIQEYVQEIGRYRGQAATLCSAFLTDETVCRLYSATYASALNRRSARSFLNDLMGDEGTGVNYVSYRHAEHRYDLSESTLRTLLILLENVGCVKLEMDFNNHFVVTPFAHQTVVLLICCDS